MPNGESLEMAPEFVDDDVGERNGAMGCRGLGWSEERWSAGEKDELLVDPQGAFVEIDVVGVETEALALPQAGAGAQDYQRPVAVGYGIGECLHGARCEWLDLDREPLGEVGSFAR